MIKLITASPASGMTLSLFCSPPAVKTESAQGLAALAGSGQAGRSNVLRPFVLQFRKPAGWWVRSCDVQVLARSDAEARRS